MNTLPSLSDCRRTLDKAHDIYQTRMLDVDRELRPSSWQEAYYSSSSLKSFTRRFEAYRKDAGATLRGSLECAYVAVVAAWNCYEAARLEEKARKTQKRAAVAAKKSQRDELNLQEGVSLKGVDVGQYKVILAGLEPVRLHVYAEHLEGLKGEIQACRTLLKARNNVLRDHADLTGIEKPGYRAANEAHDALVRRINRWFYRSEGYDQNSIWAQRRDNPERIETSAQQFALAYVQGYAAKLAVKVGEYIAEKGLEQHEKAYECHVSSNDLWRNSVATIRLASHHVKFHTQIIWNRSCLGKVFNQYPTRRVE